MSIKKGWRWRTDGLYWCKEWENEDEQSGANQEDRTNNITLDSMNSILEFLTFTMESPKDFKDKKLPTLDIRIWISAMKIW